MQIHTFDDLYFINQDIWWRNLVEVILPNYSINCYANSCICWFKYYWL